MPLNKKQKQKKNKPHNGNVFMSKCSFSDIYIIE